MLRSMRIRHLGVIDDAEIELSPGLTVISGETGAGKTMLVSGLGLLLGQRADSGVVRHGHASAVVEGVLEVPRQHPSRERVKAAGGVIDDNELILTRTVTAEGRSRAHVGGQRTPVSVLSEVAQPLVAVHGQADQWRLKKPEEHLTVLDSYGAATILPAREKFQQAYRKHAELHREHRRLVESERTRLQESVVLRAGLEDIHAIAPQPHEDEDLKAESQRLTHLEGLLDATTSCLTALAGSEDPQAIAEAPALGQLHAAARSLAQVLDVDPQLGALHQRLTEVSVVVADIAAEVSTYLSSLEADPHRAAWVHERRAELTRLTRTYADTLDGVLEWARHAQTTLDSYDSAELRIEALAAELDHAWADVCDAAIHLSRARKDAAATLSQALTEELTHLAMGKARVEVRVSHTDHPEGMPFTDDTGQIRTVAVAAEGLDTVEILMAANPGTPARSVAKAASGGELSRLMLAIEVATGGGIPTYVFDEVDAGVGGTAALDVGQRLAALARSAQVIVVTHVPQVAAYADKHLVIHKAHDGLVTSSGVTEVQGQQRREELARMMAGNVTEVALKHAEELLSTASRRTRRRLRAA